MTTKLLYTLPEACGVLGLSRSKFYELMDEGAIKPVHMGRSIRIPVSELEDFVKRLIADSNESTDQS